MKITVEVKNVYGINQVYPVSEDAKTLAEIAGTRTLTKNILGAIKKLGYDIEVVQPELTI